jgi:hypothetical protein
MLKWLRKYNKALLIFFGSFLMIAFLVPQAIQQFSSSGAETMLTVNGRAISITEGRTAQQQLQGLGALTYGQFPAVLGIDPREIDHWLLAREAASRAGYFGGASDGASIIALSAQNAVFSRLTPQQRFMVQYDKDAADAVQKQVQALIEASTGNRSSVARGLGLQDRQLDEALAAVDGLARMQQAYVLAPKLSEKRLIHRARESLDQAQMQVLFISADPNLAAIPDPTQEQLQEHFQKYRDKPAPVAGAAAGASPFGYLRPRRFKLEYLAIDRAGVEQAAKVSPVEVQKKMLGDEMKNEADPAKRRAAIEASLRRDLVEKVQREAMLAYRAEMAAAMRSFTDDGTYRILPADWATTRPSAAAIAQRIVEKVKQATGVEIPLPTVTVRDRDWVVDGDLRLLPGIGMAILPVGNDSIGLIGVLSSLKELHTPGAPRPEIIIQAGVPFNETLVDFSGNQYFLTVLDARAESPPESLDEVRTQVIADRKKADAYAKLAEQLPTLEAMAMAQSIDSVQEYVNAGGGVKTDLRSGVTVSKTFLSPADCGANDQAFRDAVVAKMARLDPTVALETAPPMDLHVSAAVPAKMGIAIGKFTAYMPATLERFRQQAGQLGTGASSELMPTDTRGVLFDRDRLIKTLHAEFPGRIAEKEAATDKADEKAPAEGQKTSGGTQ